MRPLTLNDGCIDLPKLTEQRNQIEYLVPSTIKVGQNKKDCICLKENNLKQSGQILFPYN